MIRNFEDYTEGLTTEDITDTLPMVVAILKGRGRGKGTAITNLHLRGELELKGILVGSPKVRKMINYIRRRNVVPYVCATSKGYYIAETRQEMQQFIESLEQREDAIRQVRISLQSQLADANIVTDKAEI